MISDWAVVELQFSTFKNRGELLLKGTETGEVIMALEDSLMVINSLLSNRFSILIWHNLLYHNRIFLLGTMLLLRKIFNFGRINS